MGRKWVWFFGPAAATTSLFIAVAAFSDEGGDRLVLLPAATTTTQSAQTTRLRSAPKRTTTSTLVDAATTTTARQATAEATTTTAPARRSREVIPEDFDSSAATRLPPESARAQTTTAAPPASAAAPREQTTTPAPTTTTTTAASRTEAAGRAATRRRRARAKQAPLVPSGKLVRVPDLVGLSSAQAAARLKRDGFRPRARRERSFAPDGTVFQQQPLAGQRMQAGRTVLFTVSFFTRRRPPPPPPAPPVSALPRLIGLDYWEAAARAELRGLIANSYPVRAGQRADDVANQMPAPGTRVRKGARILITVSIAKKRTPLPVPDTVGLKEAAAHARCRDAHFTCRTMPVPAGQTNEVGRVLRQKPEPGDVKPELTQIKLFVGE
jgi:beta-lactam-binding protein with PASTA domain